MGKEKIRDMIKSKSEGRRKYTLNYWKYRKPFKNEDDIPDIPIVSEEDYRDIIIPNIIRCGGIPKSELKPHTIYLGSCRNSNEAEWTGKDFLYCRHKFGTEFLDTVQHFEDGGNNDNDVFVPIKEK